MAIHYYIGINDLQGQKHVPDSSTMEDLAKRYEYLVCQEMQTLPGSFGFNFTVFDSELKGTRIKNNGWTITEIYTAFSNTAQPVILTILDPLGLSNKDAEIIRVDKPTADSITFGGLGTESLNRGLTFFKEVSQYSSWTEFLNSNSNQNFTTKSPHKEKGLHKANNERLVELEEENQVLKEKISQIRSLLV